MNKKSIVFSFLFLTSSACSPQELRLWKSRGERVPGPNGYSNYVVSCYDITVCYTKANRQCHGKYEVVETTHGMSEMGHSVYDMLVNCL